MSDTPRTDEAKRKVGLPLSHAIKGYHTGAESYTDMVPVEISRQLERELNSAKQELEAAKKDASELRDRLIKEHLPAEYESWEKVFKAQTDCIKERDQLKQSAGFCDKHKPNGGSRNCLVCGCEELSHALDKISYACGKPNEMGVSEFSTHYNPDEVVKQVETMIAELVAARRCVEACEVLSNYYKSKPQWKFPGVEKCALDALTAYNATKEK